MNSTETVSAGRRITAILEAKVNSPDRQQKWPTDDPGGPTEIPGPRGGAGGARSFHKYEMEVT